MNTGITTNGKVISVSGLSQGRMKVEVNTNKEREGHAFRSIYNMSYGIVSFECSDELFQQFRVGSEVEVTVKPKIS